MFELDHLAFGARDVEKVCGSLARLGFATTPIGMCRWSIAGRAYSARSICVVLKRGYLDVIESRDPRWEQQLQSSQIYDRGMAPSGVVLSSPSVERARAMLLDCGVAIDTPYTIERELIGADPPVLTYRIFSTRPGGLPLAVIEDLSPGGMQVRRWTDHPNSAVAIARFHVRVSSPSETASQLSGALGLKPKRLSSTGGWEIDVGEARLVLHDEPGDEILAASSRHVERTDRPVLIAIEFEVENLNTTIACLREAGEPTLDFDGGIAVDPNGGYGCGMIFRGPAI